MEKNKKPKKMFLKIFLISLAVIIIIIVSTIIYINNSLGLPETKAIIQSDENTIISRGINEIRVNGETKLKEGDIITTKDSRATIILYDSLFINLEENTRIKITNLDDTYPTIYQEYGTTWNKFTKISSLEGYSVETKNSVSSVSGTFFGINAAEEFSKILVGEGTVIVKTDATELSVTKMEKAEIGLTESKMNMNSEEINTILQEMGETKKELQQERIKKTEEFLDKNKVIVDQIEKNYNVSITPEEIELFFKKVDNNEIDITQLREEINQKIPVMNKEFVNYLDDLSTQIKTQEEAIKELELKK